MAGGRRPRQARAGRRGLRRADRPPLPPRRGVRRGGRRGVVGAGERGRHPPRDRVRERARGGPLPPHQLDRRGRRVPRRVPGGHVRRGAAAAPPLPPDQVRVRAPGARAASRPKTLVFRPGIVVGHSETGEMDKIDGPYYFFKLLQRLRHALPEWVPLAGPAGRRDEHRAGGLRGAGDGPHRPHPGRRSPRGHVPPREPGADDGGRDAQRVREGRPRAAARDARGRERDERHPQAGARRADGAAHRQADPQPGLPRPRDPAGGDGEPRLPLQVRRPRRPARAHGHRHRGAAAVAPTPRALWDYWERNLDPDLFRERSLAELDQGQADPDHRRLERHRASRPR